MGIKGADESETILFAGGGTGGHVFPLVAVADAIRRLRPSVDVVFVGTEKGIETRVVPERGYSLELMRVAPIRGRGVCGAIRGIGGAARALPEARALIQRRRPRAVLSIGGYAAGPVSLAARWCGVPLALIEPNAVIGLANQLVAPLVDRGYTAFAEPERWFRRGRVVRSGVPLRFGFRPEHYRRGSDVLKILVLGGSQGAKSLNEAVPRALRLVHNPVRVVHQCGRSHEAAVRALYSEQGESYEVEVIPFIDDMAQALTDSDLIVSRSGASAVSEICAVGRPSVLIPFPFAAADHQLHNALAIERAGAGICLRDEDATPLRLAQEFDRLASQTGVLESMAERAAQLGQPEASITIACDILALAGLQPGTIVAHDSEIGSGAPSAESPECGRGFLRSEK